jgi:hypothetical protein
MTAARIIHLPRTPAGRELLRECIRDVCDYRWPNGDAIEDEDFDELAAFLARPTAKGWNDDRETGLAHPAPPPPRGGERR